MPASNRKKGERFAKLPIDLLRDPAVTTLPHAAFRVLTIFAAGYVGDNNGTLACTDTWMKPFGIVSRDTTYSSIRLLLDRGLIEITRPGIKHRRMPTLYAVTWLPVNYRDGQILGRFTPATHAYKQWKAPTRLKKKVPTGRKRTAEFQSDGRTSTSPIVGPVTACFSPISPTKPGVFQSDGRENSRTLDGSIDSVAAHSAPNPIQTPGGPRIDDRMRKARKLLAASPDIDNAKLQSTYQLTDAELKQVRQ